MTEADYRAAPGINISNLKNMSKSALHYKFGLDHPRADTAAMAAGRAFHMAVLQPELFAATYAIRPAGFDGRTTAGKIWLQDNGGREILADKDGIVIRAMADAIRRHRTAAGYLSRVVATELPLFWKDEETGLLCKGKIDGLCDDGTLLDLKKTKDITLSWFFGQAYRLGVHRQIAFYFDALKANGIDVPEALILAVEGEAPYDVAPLVVPPEIIEEGRAEYRVLLRQVAECQASGRWPGVVPQKSELALPSWARWIVENDDDTGEVLADCE